MVQCQAEFLSFAHNLCINARPTWPSAAWCLLIKCNFEQGIAAIGFTDTISPSPKALWNTRSPAAKFGSGLLLAAEASDALGAAFAAETYRARATCGRESVGSGAVAFENRRLSVILLSSSSSGISSTKRDGCEYCVRPYSRRAPHR